jgi:hypothetical protein
MNTIFRVRPCLGRAVPVAPPAQTYNGRLGPAFYNISVPYSGIGGYSGTQPMQVFIPANYRNDTPHRVHLAMCINRGTDGTAMMSEDVPQRIVASPTTWPRITICFQHPNNSPEGGRQAAWALIQAAFNKVAEEWNPDPLRRYMTGFSIGGIIGLESLFYLPPGYLAGCLFSECNITTRLDLLTTVSPHTNARACEIVAGAAATLTAIRHHHNTSDGSIPLSSAQEVETAFEAIVGNKYDLIPHPGGSHDPGTCFGDPAQWAWLDQQVRAA